MLKKYLIAYFFVLVNFVFVVTFVIKNKNKKKRKVGQTSQISHTGSNCPYPRALTLPPPPPRIFLMANGP